MTVLYVARLEHLEIRLSLKNAHFEMIENFNRIKRLHIYVDIGNDSFDQYIIDLVRRNSTLEEFIWIHHPFSAKAERFPFGVELYDQLVSIVKNRGDNRKLVVEFCPNFATIPHYSSEMKFVQIRNR